jgi:cholesterol oxidase
MSQVPVFDAARASKIKPIQFSEPREGLVSALTGSGDLAKSIAEKQKSRA